MAKACFPRILWNKTLPPSALQSPYPTPLSLTRLSFSSFPGQNVIAGVGLGISDKLISLDVSSPHVPDLTLIDLPGITRVAVGNQPADIGRQVRL